MIDSDISTQTPRRHVTVEYLTRSDTNDGALAAGIINADEYGLGRLPRLSGVAIDIGAHIGVVAIALALDHPELKVVAVEAVPENCEVLRANVEHNGLAKRVLVIEAAAAAPGTKKVKMLWGYRSAENADQAYVDDSRYIANIFGPSGSESDEHTVKAVDLDTLMKGLERLTLLKIDCEGCEWQFLRSPRVKDIDLIIGEYHNAGGLATLQDLLPDHEVTQAGGLPDIGLFRAVRR